MNENGLKFEEFEYTSQKIRMLTIDEESWFVVKDVCETLGVKNYRNVLSRLKDNEKKVINVHNVDLIQKRRGSPKLTLTNEPGLYRMIFSFEPSKMRGKPNYEVQTRQRQLEEFKNWVYYEVLPSIRKTGEYNDTKGQFNNLCPIKFDRVECYKIAQRKVRESGLNKYNANLLWRDWYIGFSQELGFNIDTKAKLAGVTKIEWLEKNGYMERFCKFISREEGD